MQALDGSDFAPALALRVSAGVAVAADASSAAKLMADADRALLPAKVEGRNRVCVAARARARVPA